MMKFLNNILNDVEEYRDLFRAVESGRMPAMATGLTNVHKAHVVHSICTGTKRKALVLASDEAEAQRLCDDLRAMGTKTVFCQEDVLLTNMLILLLKVCQCGCLLLQGFF